MEVKKNYIDGKCINGTFVNGTDMKFIMKRAFKEKLVIVISTSHTKRKAKGM